MICFTFGHFMSHKISKLISNGFSSHWNSAPPWPTGLSVYLGNTMAWVRNPRISFFIRLIYSLFNFTHVTNHYFPRIELHLIKFNSYDSLSKMWSYFSSIHPFTALKLFVWFFFSGQLWDGFVTPNSCIKIQTPPSHPLIQCCAQ